MLLDALGRDWLGVAGGAVAAALIAYAYIRVSSPEQALIDRTGLLREVLRIDELARKEGAFIPFDNVFGDDFTGEEEIRPWLDRLLEAVGQGPKGGVCYVESMDRLGRTRGVQWIIAREFARRRGSLRFVREQSETERIAFGMAAEMENAAKRERTRGRNLVKMYKNELISFTPTYGYCMVKSPEGVRVFVLDQVKAEVVRLIHRKLRELDSVGKVRSYLHEKGIPAPRGGRVWSHATVHKILTDTSYIGVHIQNRYYMESLGGYTKSGRPSERVREKPKSEWRTVAVPRILKDDVFEDTQRSLKRAGGTGKAGRPAQTLLRSRLRCRCSRSMTLGGGLKGRAPRYHCPRHTTNEVVRHGKDFCPQADIKVEVMDGAVWTSIARMITQPRVFLAMLAQQYRKPSIQDRRELERQLAKAERTYENANRALQVTFEKAQRRIPEEVLDAIETTRAKRDEIKAKLAAAAQVPALPSLETLKAVLARFDPNVVSFEDRRKVICQLIDEAVVAEDGSVELTGVIPRRVPPVTDEKSFSALEGRA